MKPEKGAEEGLRMAKRWLATILIWLAATLSFAFREASLKTDLEKGAAVMNQEVREYWMGLCQAYQVPARDQRMWTCQGGVVLTPPADKFPRCGGMKGYLRTCVVWWDTDQVLQGEATDAR
jgi:hypothetical protein